MNDDDKSTLWIGAFRYYCGRRTYAVSNFCNALRFNWAEVPEHARSIIARDLEEEFALDDRARRDNSNAIIFPLGNTCDRREWETIRTHIRQNMTLVDGQWKSNGNYSIRVGDLIQNNSRRATSGPLTVYYVSPDYVRARSAKGRSTRIPAHRVHTFKSATGYSRIEGDNRNA